MELRQVYLDNNATTKIDEQVLQYMLKYYREHYAVASSQFSHTPGIKAREGVDWARETIAKTLGSKPEEIIFTSGGSESNNLAIKGVAFANLKSNRKKIVISSIEHFSVLHSAKFLEKLGFKVEEVKVDSEGFVDLEDLSKKVDDSTLLVSIIHGNHEVGTVQELKQISEIVHKVGAYFHSDAVASFMQVPINVDEAGVDLLSISAHKIYGPKGVGALYVRKGTKIRKLIDGGYQEFDLRGGTENVPGIVGFGKAVELFDYKEVEKVKAMRDYLYNKLIKEIPHTLLNGPKDFSKRLPNNLNVSFEYIEGESVVLHLDMRGISVITGSACFSRALQASHILLAMGFSHERAHGSIRYSLSKYLNYEDLDYTVIHTKEVVESLRKLSPLYLNR